MVGAFITFLLSFQPLSFLFFLFFYLTFLNFLPVKKLAGTGPTTYPIIGCLLSFYKNRFRLLNWYTDLLARSPTNTILVRRLGTRRTIITANQHNVEYVLKTNFKNFPKGKPFTEILGDFLGKGIFNVDGDLWIKQRKLASHEFSLRSMNNFIVHTLEEEVNEKLLPLMDSLCIENKVVDFQELLGRFSFNVICKFTFGSYDDDDNNRCCLDPSFPISPLARAFDVAAEISARRGAAPLFLVWRVKKWLRVGSEKRLREAVNEVQTRVMEMISKRKRKMNVIGEKLVINGQDLLSRLISSGHDEEVIRDMVISLIMAGRDTTSSALTWFFWLLSSYSEIEQRILKEILDYDCDYDYESLKNMNYLKACLCESMRLYPPVAWDSKHATCDDILPDGTMVKSGDRVTYFPYGMGRMENLWGKDWFEFRPDRWFVEPVEPGKKEVVILKEVCPFKYPIFQGGPRVCLGKEMAFVEMKYVVASIVRRFKIKIVSSEKPMFVPLLTAHMAGGLKVFVSKRV
ncbi:unnamed protein product [Lathyrus oleraceus]|uniref:Cytochrome P450 n=1 Tax=Pisum sativum TaxID=3888 RepID=A0A9D4Y147_PEA|nr:cytochrome P450 94B3-like [Pisum sativum]KAI5431171.1 hypothetical protein KIW84_035362 [Pisum sativum]